MDERGDLYRKSLRLEGYDYSNEGAYFVTLIAYKHRCTFGKIKAGNIFLSNLGRIAYEEWFKSADLRTEIELYEDEFAILPNHIHGIVWIDPSVGRHSKDGTANQHVVRATGQLPIHNEENGRRGPKPKSLSSFIVGYKGQVTRKINKINPTPGEPIWMRNFHDRVIRNERELNAIREYIQNNPLKWELDQYYSASTL